MPSSVTAFSREGWHPRLPSMSFWYIYCRSKYSHFQSASKDSLWKAKFASSTSTSLLPHSTNTGSGPHQWRKSGPRSKNPGASASSERSSSRS